MSENIFCVGDVIESIWTGRVYIITERKVEPGPSPLLTIQCEDDGKTKQLHYTSVKVNFKHTEAESC